jgi:hypothetical protein
MKNKKNKSFDCIAMKRAAQTKIREDVRGMTIAKEIANFRKGSEDVKRQNLLDIKQIDKPDATKHN